MAEAQKQADLSAVISDLEKVVQRGGSTRPLPNSKKPLNLIISPWRA
jgi:hypothetical protein